MMVSPKRKYVPDLSEFMSQCELNYVLMLRLLGKTSYQDAFQSFDELDASGSEFSIQEIFPSDMSENPSSLKENEVKDAELNEPVRLTVVQRSRYTSTLNLFLSLSWNQWIEPLELTVRLYHDAKMAEVLEAGRNHAPPSNNDYPGHISHYADDKFQRNELLFQCLRRCLNHQQAPLVIPMVSPVVS